MMRIGIFTDTYIPQISGVVTSIQTLVDELEQAGHQVFVFTTTDPMVDKKTGYKDPSNIIRLRSVPYPYMPERRFALVGVIEAYKIAKKYRLDIIHTQTEFGMGILGKLVANRLKIPVIHTMHTKYEDYLHYIADGKLITPPMVKYIIKAFLLGTEAVICPSQMTLDTVNGYGVKVPKRIIPTGIEINRFIREDIRQDQETALRQRLGLKQDDIMLLSLSRLSKEKNIQAIVRAMPEILGILPAKLVIVGHGPYQEDLEQLILKLNLKDQVIFTGPIENDQVVYYYKAADIYISASTSETQGLTFAESLASGTPILASRNPYVESLVTDPQFGALFDAEQDIAILVQEIIKHSRVWDNTKYQDKLVEISSQTFAQHVVDFYQEMIDTYKPLREKTMDSVKAAPSKMLESTQQTMEMVKTAPVKVRQSTSNLTKKIANVLKSSRKK